MFSLHIAKKKRLPGLIFFKNGISRHPEKLHWDLVLDWKKTEVLAPQSRDRVT